MIFDYVARQNIEHFKKLLDSESDPQKRILLAALLREEEGKISDAPTPAEPPYKKI